MYELNEKLTGIFDIEFVGGAIHKKVNVEQVIVNANQVVLLLITEDDHQINWSTVIRMKRVSARPTLN